MLTTVVCSALLAEFGAIEINGEDYYPGVSDAYFTKKFDVAKELFGWDDGMLKTWFLEKDVTIGVLFDKWGASQSVHFDSTNPNSKNKAIVTSWNGKKITPHVTKLKDVPGIMEDEDPEWRSEGGEGIEIYEYVFFAGPEATWRLSVGFTGDPGLTKEQAGEHLVESFTVGYDMGPEETGILALLNKRRKR